MKPFFSFNSLDLTDKNKPRKKVSSRGEFSNEFPDDSDKIPPNPSKPQLNFDPAEFGLFFKHKPTNSRSSNGSKSSQMHNKKKSYETSSSKESTLKRMSSKDFSHLEELFANTIVISNPPDTKHNPKRASNEIFLPRTLADEPSGTSAPGLDAKKNMRGVSFSGFVKPVKEEDDYQDQEILGTISKLGLGGDHEEQKTEPSFSKDRKLNNINPEVMERIMTKSLHSRRISGAGGTNSYVISPTTPTYFNPQIEGRHNNNSLFKNLRPGTTTNITNNNFNNNFAIKKDVPPKYQNVPTVMISPYETENNYPVVPNPMSRSHTQGSLGQETELLTKSLEIQDFKRGLDTTGKKNQNPATRIPTDSTKDSEKNYNYHNNGFSTPFSGTSTSFHNSGKADFNSPLRADSGRPRDNFHGHSHINNLMASQSTSGLPIQRTLFNMGPNNLMSLHGSHASGNNTDRSNSFSWNEEFPNSAMGTPQQPRHQRQTLFNTSLNTLPTISTITFTKDHQYVQPGAGPQTTRNPMGNNSFLAPSGNLNQSVNLDVSNSSIKNQEKNSSSSKKQNNNPNNPNNPNNSNSKSKKKNQDPKDESLFIIDLKTLEKNHKTTLMVKNIPNKYDLPMMIQAIEKNHKGKFDFLYLPIDPRNKCNVGYAFINFIDTKYIRDFYLEFNNKKWERFNSEKVCEIKYARIQGKKALMHHFQYSNVMNQQDKKLRPYIPPEYELLNHKKIKDLVTKQRLESAVDQYESK